ncbi:MAG: lytic transglycosylase domain-containing protein [Candidatus Adiutrix sp.]|nr:lytic transglycosylase domain-containing protein [Candidatus Adiutrix sp.]
MMILKKHSAASEIVAWIFFGGLSAGLASPLVFPAVNPAPVQPRSLPPLSSSQPALPVAGSPADIPQLASLVPSPDLLNELGQSRSRVTFHTSLANYDLMIEQAARLHQVSPLLVKAVIQAESDFNPRAVSNRGAVGLMQVMPSTARSMGVLDARDPQKNINAGVKYLKHLLTIFNDDEKLAIAAYNCGPGAMRRWDNRPPYRETKNFVELVMTYYNTYLDS